MAHARRVAQDEAEARNKLDLTLRDAFERYLRSGRRKYNRTGGGEPASAHMMVANWGNLKAGWCGCCVADGNPVRCSCHAARQQTTIRQRRDGGVAESRCRWLRSAPDFLTLEAYKHIYESVWAARGPPPPTNYRFRFTPRT
jgi:hypothetical protein